MEWLAHLPIVGGGGVSNRNLKTWEDCLPFIEFAYNRIMHTTCHTPIPGPTRLADPNRFPGRETQDWDSLPDFFFFFLKPTGVCGYSPHLVT